MNTTLQQYSNLYTCMNKYNFNFSKMVIDTKIKFSA